MAFSTILPEAVLMHIPVAACATAVFQFTENLECCPVAGYDKMAFGAFNLLVLSFQREVALVVIETRSWAEFAEIMAGSTLLTKCTLVIIGMARKTFLFKPQECACPFF